MRSLPMILGLLAALSALAFAQQGPFYVDPTFGVDRPQGQPNPPGVPYRTINVAIDDAAATFPTPAQPALVRCLPGVYSPFTNGEVFPIQMEEFVDVESVAGATATIIVGYKQTAYIRGAGIPNGNGVFLPMPPFGNRSTALEVLVSGTGLGAAYAETFDGFTLRGGDLQFYIETELSDARWTISNCVLDMLHEPPQQEGEPLPVVPGPFFGLLQVQTFEEGIMGYHEIATNFLNNTVIMGWSRSETPASNVLSDANAIGFGDVSDPAMIYPNAVPDPAVDAGAPPLRGIGPPNIQNCIFRTLAEQPLSVLPFIGIDATDVATSVGTWLGNTNAFDAARGALQGNATFVSIREPSTPQAPTPRIDVNPNATGGRDPGFVGEYVNVTSASGTTPTAFESSVRDWKLLPSSPYVELGSSPDISGNLAAVNGSTFTRRVNNPLPFVADSFDWDGEGLGNPRIAVPPGALAGNPGAMAEVDLGFDEVGALSLARSYGNDGRVHGVVPTMNIGPPSGQVLPYPNGAGNGTPQRELLLPGTGGVVMSFNSVSLPDGPTAAGSWIGNGGWPSMFPAFGLVPVAGEIGYQFLYAPLNVIPIVFNPTPVVFVPTQERQVPVPPPPHVFGSIPAWNPKTPPFTPFAFTWQATWVPTPLSGQPLRSHFTNAQSEIQ